MASLPTMRRSVKLVIEGGLGATADVRRALALARSGYYRNQVISTARRRI